MLFRLSIKPKTMYNWLTPLRLALVLLVVGLLLLPRVMNAVERWQIASRHHESLLAAESTVRSAPQRIAMLEAEKRILAENGTISTASLGLPALLDSLGNRYDVRLVSLPREEIQGATGVAQATLEGQLPALLSFLHALESSQPPVRIQRSFFRTEEVRHRGMIKSYLLCDLRLQRPRS